MYWHIKINFMNMIKFNIFQIIYMNIKTYNKSLAEQVKKGLNFSFEKQVDPSDQQTYLSNDTDSVKYRVVAKSQLLVLYFFAVDVKIVFNYCSQFLKKKYYTHVKLSLKNIGNQECLQILLDPQGLEAYNKSYVPKEQKGVITGKKKFDALFEYLSKKFASIKRHFYASPYEMMLEAIKFNTTSKQPKRLPNLSYNIRQNGSERIWISYEIDQVTVYYGVSFEDRSEQQLCRILFSELLDARKHVQNPPSFALMESEFSKNLVASFPEQKNNKYSFTNGIVAITIHSKLLRNPESSATYLAGFRNYIYYHIQAQKCYLHSRELRIINNIHHNLKHTKIQPFVTK